MRATDATQTRTPTGPLPLSRNGTARAWIGRRENAPARSHWRGRARRVHGIICCNCCGRKRRHSGRLSPPSCYTRGRMIPRSRPCFLATSPTRTRCFAARPPAPLARSRNKTTPKSMPPSANCWTTRSARCGWTRRGRCVTRLTPYRKPVPGTGLTRNQKPERTCSASWPTTSTCPPARCKKPCTISTVTSSKRRSTTSAGQSSWTAIPRRCGTSLPLR